MSERRASAGPNLGRRGTSSPTRTGDEAPTASTSAQRAHSEPGRPNPYPHRLSVDVDANTYRALRLIAAEEGCRLIDVVRAGIAHEIDTRR